jgi:ABC-type uncharacterized transport system permease subunit
MILSSASSTLADFVLGVPSLFAALAYICTAFMGEAVRPRLQILLLLGWAAHLLALVLDIAGFGQALPGARFGFAPALSATVWLVLAVYMIESRFLPLPGVRRLLAGIALVAVVLAFLFPGESRPHTASPWAPLHWMLGLASYGMFGVAVLHAVLLNRAERQLRHVGAAAGAAGGSGSIGRQGERPAPVMPLLRLERLTFQFVAAGVAVLSLALLLGWWFTPHWRWDHKNLFAVLGWLVLSGLLAGRRVFGWRGRRATRWLYFGALLLLLSYAGSRFVMEVVLQRQAGY